MAKELPVDIGLGEALPLGSRIRLRRQTAGRRLSAMADSLGYNRGYLSRVENNQANPSDELVTKIADYFGISVSELKEGSMTRLIGAPPPRLRRGQGTVLAAPPLPARKRSLGERIERLVAMAHLTAAEEEIVAERLVAVTSELLALIKATRSLR